MKRAAWLVVLGFVAMGCDRSGSQPVIELTSPAYLYLDEETFRHRVEAAPIPDYTRGEDPRNGHADMLGWRSRIRIIEKVPGGAKVIVEEGHSGYKPDPSMKGKVGWILDGNLKWSEPG